MEDDKNDSNDAQAPVPKVTRARGRYAVFRILQDCSAVSVSVFAHIVNFLFSDFGYSVIS